MMMQSVRTGIILCCLSEAATVCERMRNRTTGMLTRCREPGLYSAV